MSRRFERGQQKEWFPHRNTAGLTPQLVDIQYPTFSFLLSSPVSYQCFPMAEPNRKPDDQGAQVKKFIEISLQGHRTELRSETDFFPFFPEIIHALPPTPKK